MLVDFGFRIFRASIIAIIATTIVWGVLIAFPPTEYTMESALSLFFGGVLGANLYGGRSS